MKWYQKNKTLATIVGFILLPVLFSLYIVDRFLLVFLCWMNAPTIIEYFTDYRLVGWSVARVFTLSLIIFIVCLII